VIKSEYKLHLHKVLNQMSKLSELRKSRNSFEKLNKDIENNKNASKDYSDERYWQCSQDDSKNGQAVIRFLPAYAEGDEAPFVKMFRHSFKGPTNKWYVENCLSTLGQNDPCVESNNLLWESGTKENKELVQGIQGKNARKRKTDYHSNILVISDPAKPENNGKVFLFKYGQSIFGHIESAVNPEFADDKPKNPFDVDEGYNFRLRMIQKDGYANFDKSSWSESPSAIADSDEEIEAILNKCYSLSEIIAPDKFKSYADLKKRLDMVLGNKSASEKNEEKGLSDEDAEFLRQSIKSAEPKVEDKPKRTKDAAKPEAPVEQPRIAPEDLPDAGGSDEDDMDYFSRLANE
jgi:hypothetical protein